MIKHIFVIILLVISFNFQAHNEGHGRSLIEWKLDSKTEHIKANFIKYENNIVWLMGNNHQLESYKISDFTKENQNYIQTRTNLIQSLNGKSIHETYYIKIALLILGCLLMTISVFNLRKRKKIAHLAYGVIGVSVITFASCNDNNLQKIAPIKVPENKILFLQSLFEKFEGVETHSDNDYIYISSNGLPTHKMMVGITSWQQQVPINQNYTENNSWAIPLKPKMAINPLSTKTNLMKGAIAVAVNGIPIFNPLNNRGEDAKSIGELDKWGGHCGRADDYHYHLPPLHLQEQVGEGKPVAYAVDGFPVYGETTATLDEYLGITNPDGSYQYHAIKDYPYLIAGMRGEVKLDSRTKAPENQVTPQPRTQELRPALRPLRGAEIIEFKIIKNNSYVLTYLLNSENYRISYSWDSGNNYTYEFISPNGTSTIENYKR